MIKIQTFLLSLAMLLAIVKSSGQTDRMLGRETALIYEGTEAYLVEVSLDVPAKYQSESAVALADIWVENYEDKGAKLLRIAHQRWLVKLQDKAALEEFSTFTLDSRSVRAFGYRDVKKYALTIRKADGSKVEVNLERLEKNADDEVAIPNLNIGDILDFGMRIEETVIGEGCFEMRINTLSETFPSIYGYQRYEVGRGFFINYRALNGAPSLQLNEALSDRKNLVYELKYNEIPSSTDETWAPDYRTNPSYKMQICYFPLREADRASAFLGDPYTVKTSVSNEERKQRLENGYKSYFYRGVDPRTAYYDKWMRKNFPEGITSKETFMNTAYFHYRYFTLIFDPLVGWYKSDYHTRYIKSEFFLKVMIQAAKNRNIPVELVFTNNKYWSDWDDVITESEVATALRYKGDDGNWKYMENPRAYQTPDYITYTLQGQKGLAYDGEKFEEITIPIVPAQDNVTSAVCKVNLNLETREADVNLRSSCIATFKYQSSYAVLDETEYHLDAASAMLPSGQEDAMFEKRSAARQQERSEKVVEMDKDVKFEKMKKLRSEDFDVDTYKSFELINSGVFSEADSLVYAEGFTIKDVVEKVGPNYVINLQRISFDQVSFTDEEQAKRLNDVYLNYPKTYNYDYRITLPDGFSAVGLENLNQQVDTEYGSVLCSASQKGNVIYIKLNKSYKESFVPKEDWSKLMAFLSPASKINSTKIVLKAK